MNTLNERETLILALVQQGLTNYQIAVVGNLSYTEVYQGIRSVKDKLGVNSKQEMIALIEEKQP